jgi:hypothetical protein
MTGAAQALGIMASILATVLWLMGRWAHEVQRCLRGASDGGRAIEDCAALVSVPAPAFALWLPLIGLSAMWGVVLLVKGKRTLGVATLGSAVAVLILAGSFM